MHSTTALSSPICSGSLNIDLKQSVELDVVEIFGIVLGTFLGALIIFILISLPVCCALVRRRNKKNTKTKNDSKMVASYSSNKTTTISSYQQPADAIVTLEVSLTHEQRGNQQSDGENTVRRVGV